jgi:hypothetical protein
LECGFEVKYQIGLWEIPEAENIYIFATAIGVSETFVFFFVGAVRV